MSTATKEKPVKTAIILDEFYRIEPDAASWNLMYQKEGAINANGVPSISRDASFHATLSQALKAYLSESLKESTDISDILERIDEVERNIDKACEGVKREQII